MNTNDLLNQTLTSIEKHDDKRLRYALKKVMGCNLVEECYSVISRPSPDHPENTLIEIEFHPVNVLLDEDGTFLLIFGRFSLVGLTPGRYMVQPTGYMNIPNTTLTEAPSDGFLFLTDPEQVKGPGLRPFPVEYHYQDENGNPIEPHTLRLWRCESKHREVLMFRDLIENLTIQLAVLQVEKGQFTKGKSIERKPTTELGPLHVVKFGKVTTKATHELTQFVDSTYRRITVAGRGASAVRNVVQLIPEGMREGEKWDKFRFTSFDTAILDLACSILLNDKRPVYECCFSSQQAARVFTQSNTPSPSLVQKIDESIKRLLGCSCDIDFSEQVEGEAYIKDQGQLIKIEPRIIGPLLPVVGVSGVAQNGTDVKFWQFTAEPPLLIHARVINQMIEYPTRFLKLNTRRKDVPWLLAMHYLGSRLAQAQQWREKHRYAEMPHRIGHIAYKTIHANADMDGKYNTQQALNKFNNDLGNLLTECIKQKIFPGFTGWFKVKARGSSHALQAIALDFPPAEKKTKQRKN